MIRYNNYTRGGQVGPPARHLANGVNGMTGLNNSVNGPLANGVAGPVLQPGLSGHPSVGPHAAPLGFPAPVSSAPGPQVNGLHPGNGIVPGTPVGSSHHYEPQHAQLGAQVSSGPTLVNSSSVIPPGSQVAPASHPGAGSPQESLAARPMVMLPRRAFPSPPTGAGATHPGPYGGAAMGSLGMPPPGVPMGMGSYPYMRAGMQPLGTNGVPSGSIGPQGQVHGSQGYGHPMASGVRVPTPAMQGGQGQGPLQSGSHGPIPSVPRQTPPQFGGPGGLGGASVPVGGRPPSFDAVSAEFGRIDPQTLGRLKSEVGLGNKDTNALTGEDKVCSTLICNVQGTNKFACL